jgi:hypothetical protein
MELIKRTTVALAAVATLGVGTAQANLIYSGIQTIGGTGLGSVATVLTLQQTQPANTEAGCVGRNAGGDFIGPSPSGACVSGTAPDVKTGNSQTQTQLLGDIGITDATQVSFLLNAAEPAGNSLSLNGLSVTFYDAAGTAIFTATCQASCLAAANVDMGVNTQTGTGNSGFTFTLDAAQAAAVNALPGSPSTYRVGLSTSLGIPNPAEGGQETYFVYNNQTAVVTPEPSTTALMATGLIGLVGFVRRRRRHDLRHADGVIARRADGQLRPDRGSGRSSRKL